MIGRRCSIFPKGFPPGFRLDFDGHKLFSSSHFACSWTLVNDCDVAIRASLCDSQHAAVLEPAFAFFDFEKYFSPRNRISVADGKECPDRRFGPFVGAPQNIRIHSDIEDEVVGIADKKDRSPLRYSFSPFPCNMSRYVKSVCERA